MLGFTCPSQIPPTCVCFVREPHNVVQAANNPLLSHRWRILGTPLAKPAFDADGTGIKKGEAIEFNHVMQKEGIRGVDSVELPSAVHARDAAVAHDLHQHAIDVRHGAMQKPYNCRQCVW